jgi:protein subunit release factor A
MESEIIDTDVQAKVEVQCGNHIYGQYIAEKVENLIKKHGTIKADEILDNIDEKVKSIKEVDELKEKIEDMENQIEDLEDMVDEEFDGDVSVTIISENTIVAEWASEEVARIIEKYGTVKAYEIFKNIN